MGRWGSRSSEHAGARDAKFTKAAVRYGPGSGEEHCGICEHFHEPDRCEIVEGPISPRGWCLKFVRDRIKPPGW